MLFLLELSGLEGRKMLEDEGYRVESVVSYPGK
jgi:adenine phosphoribosyltransferase